MRTGEDEIRQILEETDEDSGEEDMT